MDKLPADLGKGVDKFTAREARGAPARFIPSLPFLRFFLCSWNSFDVGREPRLVPLGFVISPQDSIGVKIILHNL